MPRLQILQLLVALCICVSVFSKAVHAQLDQLARRVPDSANSIVIINAQAAFSSPLAHTQKWSQGGLQAHRAGMIALPTTSEIFLMAAEMDFEFMQPQWEVAIAYVRQMPSMQEIATHCGGRLDRLAGTLAVERPNDSFVVTLGPRIIGAMSPANRQHVIRWVRKSRQRKTPRLSQYLAEAIELAGDPANHIVMALDLQDVLAPAEVVNELAQKESLVQKDSDIQALAEVIASIRGIRLVVELKNSPQARLSLNFDRDAAILSKLAKPLLLTVLSKRGVEIEDIQNWKVHTAGKSIALVGKLSQSGLRRVLSVLSGPVGPMSAAAQAEGSTDDAIAEASQRYFQSVNNYLNDLFFSDRRPQSLRQIKIWVDRYARKIEDLDRYQVDKEVVDFGRETIASLHEIVSVINRAERRTDLRDATLYESGRRRYGRYGAYGYFEKSYVTRDRQLVQADEANRGLRESQVIVDDLRDLSARTRKTMTERYNRPF